ncbi:CBO2463/CBO2479 domain-containing protein [Schnuerera sp.]|uniref:CBO2463/CBO2479 domain-containing protein n=1 Tax=Schnuerera sp. TaxID=2794844 RepID=UPI002BFED43F|nr:CBO2463/CBO2479 domain-containing protein [Schnuerera sp.]HSH35017.1 CBO2463/CBO2479 domain-containing protein [Schnuerera sp.]
MDSTNDYINQNYFQGKIVDISDGGVEIEFKGRLGNLRIPKRMIISKSELAIGKEVGFMMTYPEVLE